MSASLPLRGIRVLDFTQNLPGPYATMVLVQLGAEVVKIEPPRGDSARLFARMFEIVNAGKQSVVLDLKAGDAAARLDPLLRAADVLVEGFRPGVMQRLGLDAARVHAINPRVVYCSISGWGQAGPYREFPGHDLNFQAAAGVCHMLRDASGRPMGAALPIADLSASLTAVTAILAALIGREQTGKGEVLDVALLDTLLAWAYVWSEGLTPADVRLSRVLNPAQRQLRRWADAGGGRAAGLLTRLAEALDAPASQRTVDAIGERFKSSARYQGLRRLRLHALPHYTIYRTADERWLSIGIVDEDKFWVALCDGLGLASFGRLPLVGRLAAARPLRRLIARAIARKSLAQWLETLDRHRIPVAPVLALEDALVDPQVLERRPSGGAHLHVPWSLARREGLVAPQLGEHSDELAHGFRAR